MVFVVIYSLDSLLCRCGSFCGDSRLHFLLRWEVQLVDGIRGTYFHTLATHATLGVVYVREVVLDGDSLELALLQAERAADTSIATSFLGDTAFVLVHAANKDTATLRPFLPEFDDRFGTGLDTSTTCRTSILHHFRQQGCRVDADSIESAGIHTIAQSQTAEATARVSAI